MMARSSALYIGWVAHQRMRPQRHKLRYRMFSLLVDLDELPKLGNRLWFFSHNRFNLFSLYDRDYGAKNRSTLRSYVDGHLKSSGLAARVSVIRLLTMPRVLGFSFNPLSVYYCYGPCGGLVALLYEVHNTFGERHGYLIPVANSTQITRQSCGKKFYVSPFLSMTMRYEFIVEDPGEKLRMMITAREADDIVLTAIHGARRVELCDSRLLRLFFTYPLLTVKVIAAIHWEALRIWVKGVRFHTRPPPPEHDVTMVVRQSER